MSYNFTGVVSEDVYLKEVIYSKPATIAIWSDGTKTVCKPYDEEYSVTGGLFACYMKKFLGREEFNQFLDDWIPEQTTLEGFESRVTLRDVMKKSKR